MNADLGSRTDLGPPPPSSRAPARAFPVLWATGLAVSDLEGYGVDVLDAEDDVIEGIIDSSLVRVHVHVDVLDAEDDVIEAPSPAAGYRHPVGLVEAVQVLVRDSRVPGTREFRGI